MSLSPTTPAPAFTVAAKPDAKAVGTAHPYAPELLWNRLFLGIAAFAVVCWTVDAVLLRTLTESSAVAIRLTGVGIVCGLVTLIIAFLHRLRGAILHAVPTLQFAVALLTVVMAATMLGTFILQNELEAGYRAAYWNWVTETIFFLGFDDLFHSLWFGGLLILLALSLVLTIYKHRAWRLPTLGLFLSHFGVITLVFAGMVAYVSSFKGRIDLHEGEAAGATLITRHGRDTDDRHGLGFQLRLDRFEIEKYPAKNKLYLYHRDGETYRRLAAIDAVPGEKWNAAPAPEAAFRVKAFYPDFAADSILQAIEPGQPGVALAFTDDGFLRHLALGAGGADRIRLNAGGPLLMYLPTEPDAVTVRNWFQAQAPVHLLRSDDAEIPDPLQVNLGAKYQFIGESRHVEVLQYVADFSIDPNTHEVHSRSEQPNNPALQIRVISPDGVPGNPQWLFANAPDFAMGHGDQPGAKPRYHYELKPGRPAESRVFVIVGASGELLDCKEGAIHARQPANQQFDLTPHLQLTAATCLPSARLIQQPVTLSDQLRNPVVEVEIRERGQISSQLLSTEHTAPYEFSDHQTLLTFESDNGEIKSYRSHVTVLENGLPVLQDVIAVNSPLSYGGYQFYQANYNAKDLSYSGFQVVHDPSLPLIWIGLAMISVGVVYNYYIRPRILGRIQHDA